jgi:hypothetical protein
MTIDLWTLILAAITAAATLLTLRRDRRILFHSELSIRLVQVRSMVKQRLIVTFDGQPIQSLSLVQLAVSNEGSLPIRSEDFASPIVLQFSNPARILEGRFVEKQPSNLKTEFVISGSEAHFPPHLLNPGEFFLMNFLVADSDRDPSFDARIAGGVITSDIVGFLYPSPLRTLTWVGLVLAWVGVLSTIVLWVDPFSFNYYGLPGGALLGAMVIFLFESIFQLSSRQQRRNRMVGWQRLISLLDE